MQQANVYMYSSNSKEWKRFDKFAAVSVTTLKTVKCLPKILFNTDIMNLCLLTCFCILFKRRLERVTKVFMSEVVLTNFKFAEPIDVV